jgi:hypothetical protein
MSGSYADETLSARVCGEFGHPLGEMHWWDETPDCDECAKIVARHGQERAHGMTYVTCHGHHVGAVQSTPIYGDPKAPRWHCWWSNPGGPLFVIGRRASRKRALATVCASHDCEEIEP